VYLCRAANGARRNIERHHHHHLNAVAWIDCYVGGLGPQCCGPTGVENAVSDLEFLVCREKRLSVIAGVATVVCTFNNSPLRVSCVKGLLRSAATRSSIQKNSTIS
jgi:ribulose kinase